MEFQRLLAKMLTANISLMHKVLSYAIDSKGINFEKIKFIEKIKISYGPKFGYLRAKFCKKIPMQIYE